MVGIIKIEGLDDTIHDLKLTHIQDTGEKSIGYSMRVSLRKDFNLRLLENQPFIYLWLNGIKE